MSNRKSTKQTKKSTVAPSVRISVKPGGTVLYPNTPMCEWPKWLIKEVESMLSTSYKEGRISAEKDTQEQKESGCSSLSASAPKPILVYAEEVLNQLHDQYTDEGQNDFIFAVINGTLSLRETQERNMLGMVQEKEAAVERAKLTHSKSVLAITSLREGLKKQ